MGSGIMTSMNTLQVGDLVESVPPYFLRSGSGVYNNAVVVAVNPTILVSEYGDMLWSATLYEGCVKPVGKALPKAFSVAMSRYQNDIKRGTL